MNTSILGGIIFVLVFAGIILLHELGHFIVARWMGIEVEEFAIGFPPRLLRLWRGKGHLVLQGRRVVIPCNFDFPFDHRMVLHQPVVVTADEVKGKLVLRTMDLAATEDGQSSPDPALQGAASSPKDAKAAKKGGYGSVKLSGAMTEFRPGTEYTLNWIPLGGYNKIKGEDDPDLPGGLAAAKPWKRILVLVAGAAMNLLTAVVIYFVAYSQMGKVPDPNTVVIADVGEETPAQQAGLQKGDIILAVGDIHITGYKQLTQITHQHLGQTMRLFVLRGDQVLEVPIVPRVTYPSNQGPMGIVIGMPLSPPQNWTRYAWASLFTVNENVKSLLSLPGRLLAGTLSPEEKQVGGPRSLWNLIQQSVARDVQSRQDEADSQGKGPTNYTLSVIISLTITVAVANLLPIPALDGGRILMVLPEVFLRRRIPPKYQAAINGAGFLLLIFLLGLFYIKDFISPVTFSLP